MGRGVGEGKGEESRQKGRGGPGRAGGPLAVVRWRPCRAGAGPGGWRCAATRGGAVAAAARGPAERGNDVSLLFTFQRRVTAQRERRINQPPGDPPGAKKPELSGGGEAHGAALHHPPGVGGTRAGRGDTRGPGALEAKESRRCRPRVSRPSEMR